MNIRLMGATALLASLAAAGCATTSPGYSSPGASPVPLTYASAASTYHPVPHECAEPAVLQ